MEIPEICRYCGGIVRLVPARMIYGAEAAKRLKLEREMIYQCQNCNARVGCHKGTTRPLGNLANEVLRLKRSGMTRTQAYKWLAEQMNLTEDRAHIGSFEMDQCQMVIELCRKNSEEAA